MMKSLVFETNASTNFATTSLRILHSGSALAFQARGASSILAIRFTFNDVYSPFWDELDSNQRRRKPTDLQSAPFSHSGTSPQRTFDYGPTAIDCQALSVAEHCFAGCRGVLQSL